MHLMSEQFTARGYRVYTDVEGEGTTPGFPARVRVVASPDPAKVWLFTGADAALLDVGGAHAVFAALDEWMKDLAGRASREVDTVKLVSHGPDPQGMGSYRDVAPSGPPPAWSQEWDNAQDATYDQE
jgi:hypothetical protein